MTLQTKLARIHAALVPFPAFARGSVHETCVTALVTGDTLVGALADARVFTAVYCRNARRDTFLGAYDAAITALTPHPSQARTKD